jgi:hypothetical protein
MKSTTAAAVLLSAAFVPSAAAGVMTEVIDFFPEGEQSVASMLRFVRPDLTGRTIVETRLYITFTPAAGFDAGDFYLLLVAPVSPDLRGDGFIFLDSRADLGWSGAGTFTAQLTFSNLNGVLNPGLWTFDVFPTIDPPIYAGTFSDDTRWEVDTVPAPASCLTMCAGAMVMARRRRR